MLNSPILVGLASGVVAALLFASLGAQTAFSFVLFYLAPLPIFIAGIGWGSLAGTIAALIGGGLAGLIMGNIAALMFLVFAGFPPVLLSHIAMLARLDPGPSPQPVPDEPGPQPQSPGVVWYPAGRIVALATLIAGGLTALAISLIGPDMETYRTVVRSFLDQPQLKDALSRSANLTPEQIERVIDVFATAILPFFAAVIWLGVLLLNFWVAAKIVQVSGRLGRPWPDLSRMQYPPFFLLAGGGAIALTFAPGMPGILALAFAGAFSFAYLVLGIIVIRAMTQSWPMQPLFMIGVYVAILLFGWPALAVVGLGLADSVFDFRKLGQPGVTPPGTGGHHGA